LQGLPSTVDNTEWRSWLGAAPVTAGTTLLDAMITSRTMRRWLDDMPSEHFLSRMEALEVGSNLLHLCDQLQEEVRFRSDVGGYGFFIASVAAISSALFPNAAVEIAFVSTGLLAIPLINALNQYRRQTELDLLLKKVRALAWRLRQ
jgi:hypothetical protein